MDEQQFLQRVKDRTGLESLELAAMAVSATMSAIGRAMDEETVEDAAKLLPSSLAKQLRSGAASPDRGGAFLADVANREQVNLGFAKEHAQVVCETLAGELSPKLRVRLRTMVPEDVADLLVPWTAPEPATPKPAPRVEVHDNLAEGRPGSKRPLSEARPDQGQSDSPAQTANPDADSKLSSGHERHGETLADGRPGSEHPISDADS